MQIDMHFEATWVMARCAGVDRDAALAIARASQFVDDATDQVDTAVHPHGARFRPEVTAHHPFQLTAHRDLDDQIRVWIPFHFLPAGIGDNLSQRLVTRADSDPARDMVRHHLDRLDKPYALELLGIGAHVYVDTWAHQGFSGVSSRLNRVQTRSIHFDADDPAIEAYLGARVARFFAKYGSQGGLARNFRAALVAGGTFFTGGGTDGALGHGAVAVYPDQPYLKWSFAYEFPALHTVPLERIRRDNPRDYLAALKALYGVFEEVPGRLPEHADRGAYRPWEAVEPVVERLLAVVGPSDRRRHAWRDACRQRRFGATGPVPAYGGRQLRASLAELATLDRPRDAGDHFAWRFNRAAALHRTWVLYDLLPRFGVVVC